MLPGSRCARAHTNSSTASRSTILQWGRLLFNVWKYNPKYLGTLFIVVNWIERSPLVGLHTYCIVLRTPNANDTDLVRLTFKLSNPLGCCEGLLEIDGRASTAEWCCSLLSERLLTCQLKVCCFNLHLLSDLTFSFLTSLHRIAFSLDPLFNNFQNLSLSSSDEGMLRRANIYSLVLKNLRTKPHCLQ